MKSASLRSFALRYAGPAAIVCCLTALVRPALPATITDLGALVAQSYSVASGINASGQVVGMLDGHAFLYSNGTMTDLTDLEADPIWWDSWAGGINNSGQVVGSFGVTATSPPYQRAFLYWNGSMPPLGTLGGSDSRAYGINASGQVVGDSITSDGYDHAFVYSTVTGMTDLGTLGGSDSWANGINANGQVVGDSITSDGYDHAFLCSGAPPCMTDLLTLPGAAYSIANGINVSGQVVGYSGTTDYDYHAFLYSSVTGMIDLHTLPGRHYSYASGINASGLVVGYSGTTGTGYDDHAFLYSGSSMIDLNSLLPAGSGWELTVATAINDSGQIVGWGYIGTDGRTHAFLLDTSVPEPGSLALLGAGLVALRLRRWLRPGKR